MADWMARPMSQAEWAAFQRWFARKYNKPLPLEYTFTGRTPSGKLYAEFVADGRPGYTPSKTEARKEEEAFWQAAKEKREAEATAAPTGVTLTGERKFIGADEYEKGSDGKWHKIEKTGMQSLAGGEIVYDNVTGKYFDPSNGFEVSYQDAQNIIAKYNKQYEPSLSKTSPAEQQWEISKNRREWAPGVNIEQDLTTGKLYRPGSMVEVSPDIATIELQQGQTGGRDWQQGAEAARLAEQKRQFDIEQARLTREGAERPELQRKQFELQWEIDRQRLLGGLAPDDWITKYLTENMPNPYKVTPTASGIDPLLTGLESQLDRQTGQVQALGQIYASRVMGEGSDSEAAQKAKEELMGAQERRDATYEAWNSVKKESRDWSPQPSRRQIYPSAPEWLPQWATEQVMGREITPQNVPTPSGQQLTQMPASIASKLGYYADWTAKMGRGRRWGDILGEAELTQPLTPRGAGGFRTSPARQWV